MSTSTTGQQLLGEYGESVLGVFGTPSLVLVEGHGTEVRDADGRWYTDLLAGIAVNALGHAHPKWLKALTDQASRLAHVSNLFTTPQQIGLAEKLLEITGAPTGSRVFFANSGTEANEAAVKLARRNGHERPRSDGRPRTRILALEHSFHGRSTGALALTAKAAYREPFAPLIEGVEHIPATFEALEATLDETVSALVVEPIQGEAGVVELPEGWLARARELTRKVGALLVVDEVQTGIGRTGRWLASATELHGDNAPDAVTLAKGLGGGFPIGAMVTFGPEASALLSAGQHGTTFGGNPLATAMGLATVTIIEQEGLLEHAASLGKAWRAQLGQVPGVAEARGDGLLIGVDLDAVDGVPNLAPRAVNAAREAGWLINATGPGTLRLAPPLVLTEAKAEEFTEALPGILDAASADRG